ncbi:hypothetical protein [Novosphingobium sp. KACC 22771]|uniref:hypothetical protein n=1 Tax=Novosphingobium sp. KACC 22771 TaxID=3025670 RepID=UPI0023661A57|nr:hypothetical protein [Novosphingobium sp. KACC 22771]WDF73617.1 hypothetical protein PQ467_06145 [Novosphingobium sp. KACC 22771]
MDDGAFIVGGQALNLWAEHYNKVEGLAAYGPYTSKDIDYFGYRQAAEKLAEALHGELLIPDADDHTPQTAIVRAVVDGRMIEVDFLWNVKGVKTQSLKGQAVELRLTVRRADGVGELRIPIMHPFHCLQSRLANVIELGRNDDLARRQLEASPIVLREYLSEMLDGGHLKHVIGVLQALKDYLVSDPNGRKAHKVMANDPAAILDNFQNDERLDERWRANSLASMRQTIATKRTAWARLADRLLSAVSSKRT